MHFKGADKMTTVSLSNAGVSGPRIRALAVECNGLKELHKDAPAAFTAMGLRQSLQFETMA
jgi:hypothetical protein